MSSPNLKASTFSAHFCAFGADATNADSFQLFLDLTLKTVLDNQPALAGTLSDEPNICALLALSADSVGLGHHFFYDGAMPLHPKCSNALFILQGRQGSPHPTAFLLDDILVGPAPKTRFKVPNLAAFSKVMTAADINKLTVAAKSVTFKSCPVLTIPPFLMGVLMHEELPDPSDLCMAVIRFCRDFNAQQNRDASDTLTIAAAAKPNDNASDEEEVDEEDADGDMKLAASIRAIQSSKSKPTLYTILATIYSWIGLDSKAPS
jgi:hypothetical protein